MPLVTAADYPSIRRLLDPDFTAEDVPDELIADQMYLPRAEAAVARLLPSDSSSDAKAAVMLLTASYLAPLFPVPESAQLEDFRYSLPRSTLADVKSNLVDRAKAAIRSAQVVAGTTGSAPTHIRVVRQSRYVG